MASINQRVSAMNPNQDHEELRTLLLDILTDLAALRTAINAHTHSGVTAGAGTSGTANASTAGTLLTTV